MKRQELIEKISPQDLKKSVYITQAILLILSGLLGFFFFDTIERFFRLFVLDYKEIFYYGAVPAVILIVLELILYRSLDKKHFDDGGINEKLFRHQSVASIFVIAFVVAFSEEVLFRGVLQTTFGYIIASTIFVLLHTRYLKKPVLLILLIFTSFFIGFLFEVTNNLMVTIVFHFLVDFVLGLYIKFQK